MKKVFYFFGILTLLFALISVPVISSAVTLDTVKADTNKTKIAPGEEVKLTVSFGKDLGAYTINVSYNKDIFEFISAVGGSTNNNDNEVIITYYDSTGGSNPRTNEVITFKAKENLTGSNPTDFSITLSGMSNADASERYDNITNAIKKDILVEPNYTPYTLTLSYSGVIKKDEKKDMKLITESAMGKNYDHVRLIAELTKKPSDTATAKLLATQEDSNEIDLLQTGWGAENGYALGGKNVKQELALRGEFNTDGKYTINIKLVDRDDSDTVIAQKSFDINVGEKQTQQNNQNTTEKLPAKYPTTGTTQYALIALIVATLVTFYFVIDKKNKKTK